MGRSKKEEQPESEQEGGTAAAEQPEAEKGGSAAQEQPEAASAETQPKRKKKCLSRSARVTNRKNRALQEQAVCGAAVSDHWDTWDTAPAHRPRKSEASWSNAPAEEPWKSGPWTWKPSPWDDACWESLWDVALRHFDAPSSGRAKIPARIRADDERFAQKKAPRTIYCDRCPKETPPFSGNNVGSFLNRPTLEVKYRRTAWLKGEWDATWLCVGCQRQTGETEGQAKNRPFGERMWKKARYRRR